MTKFSLPLKKLPTLLLIFVLIIATYLSVFMFRISQLSTQLTDIIELSLCQRYYYQNVLHLCDIHINEITESTTAETSDEFTAYDITDENGSMYLLIIRNSDSDFTALLDSDNNLIYGLLEGDIYPIYFSE